MLGAGHDEDSYTIAYGPHRFKYLELGSLGPGLGLWADVMHGINKGHVPDEMWKGLQQMSKREHQDPLTAPAQELYRAFYTDHRKGAGIAESLKVGAGEMLGRTVASFAMPSLGRQAQNATRDNQPNYRETDTDFTSAFMHSFIAGALPSTLPDRKRDDQPMAKDRFENPVATVLYRALMPFPMGSPQQPKQSTAAR
jgi:hypothetical protein